MGMNVGSSSSAEPDVMVEMNTTPLIDVMLVLLVMLIITIPIQYHAVNMNMPTGTPPPKLKEPEVVKVDVTADGRVLWNGTSVAVGQELKQVMQAAAAQAEQPEIHLRPQGKAKYATVAAVLAESQRNGLVKIGIVGSEQFVN